MNFRRWIHDNVLLGVKQPVPKVLDSKFTWLIDSQMTTRTLFNTLESRSKLQRYTTPTPGKLRIQFAAKNTVIKDSMIEGTDSIVQDDSSRSGNDTDANDANIRPIYDEEAMAEVQLTTECNIFVIGQQHTEQPEIIVEGRVDQYPETCQVKSHMLDSSPDNQTTEYSKQSLESENILLKETVA
ncbi:hypothetical protein Tco_1352423 [Tanacetum coccineum]